MKVYNKSKKIRAKGTAKVNDRTMRSRGNKTSGVIDKGKGSKKNVPKKQKMTEV